ncbi:MAG: transformation protein [Acidobacteriota bacterium]|jgi:DNA transformation protein|nr:transformation protein [Acidobacteriota bacterium]
MPKSSEFCDHLMDRLAPLGTPSYKFMFGGYGIYVNGLIMAIVSGDDVLRLRADDENRPDYEARGIGPFQPMSKNGPMGVMPYYTVPDDILDDQDAFVEWAQNAYEAAVRHSQAKAKKGTKKTAAGKTKRSATRK